SSVLVLVVQEFRAWQKKKTIGEAEEILETYNTVFVGLLKIAVKLLCNTHARCCVYLIQEQKPNIFLRAWRFLKREKPTEELYLYRDFNPESYVGLGKVKIYSKSEGVDGHIVWEHTTGFTINVEEAESLTALSKGAQPPLYDMLVQVKRW